MTRECVKVIKKLILECATDNCAICKDGSTCSTCMQGYFLENNKCVKYCSEGYMLLNNNCEKCQDLNCKTCSPTSICKNCTFGFYLHNDVCKQDCPPETFKNINTLTCDQCIYFCRKCEDNISCKVCDINFFLFSNICVDKCYDHFYPLNGRCLPCGDYQNCINCFATAPDKCSKCMSPSMLYNNTCISNCTIGTYDNGFGECIDCGLNCLNCNDKTNCTTCIQPYINDIDGKCKDQCPDGSVEKDGKCKICTSKDASCFKCNANNTNICVQCKNFKIVDTQLNTCVDKCKDNFFSDGVKCSGKNNILNRM